MTRTRSTCHYTSPFGVLVLVLLGALMTRSASAQQQFASPGIFAGAPAPAPSASLPEAPAPTVTNAMPAPAEQPLILPQNWRVAPGANGTNVPAKIGYYLGSTWSIRNLIEAFAIAGVPQITAAPVRPMSSDPNYQQELDTYGDQLDDWFHVNEATLRYHADRLEVGLATAETRQLISNLVLPLGLHQEARYIPAPVNSDFGERMENAAASIVVTRNDAGALVPNYSKLGGTVAAAFLGKMLYANAFNAPELDSNRFVARYIGYSLLGDLATNTAHELVRAALEPDLTMFNLHGRASDDSYYPLSIGGKFVYWARSTYAPRNFITAALIGGLPDIHLIENRPQDPVSYNPSTWNGEPTYDQAYNDYGLDLLTWKDQVENDVRYHGRRLAAGLSEAETQTTLQNLVIPVLFDMDPRYVPLGAGYSTGERFGHALEGLVFSHTDSGAKTVNLPVLAGTLGAAFAAKEMYYPQLGTPALETNAVLAKTLSLNFAADAIYNVIGEFLRNRGY